MYALIDCKSTGFLFISIRTLLDFRGLMMIFLIKNLNYALVRVLCRSLIWGFGQSICWLSDIRDFMKSEAFILLICCQKTFPPVSVLFCSILKKRVCFWNACISSFQNLCVCVNCVDIIYVCVGSIRMVHKSHK